MFCVLIDMGLSEIFLSAISDIEEKENGTVRPSDSEEQPGR